MYGVSFDQGASIRQLHSISPQFIVDDVEESVEYYREKLGFEFDGFWGYPPRLASVLRDGIEIMLRRSGEGEQQSVSRPQPKRRGKRNLISDACISVADVDALYRELKSRKARIISRPTDTEYETREFAVEDCNGYVICFAQSRVQQPE